MNRPAPLFLWISLFFCALSEAQDSARWIPAETGGTLFLGMQPMAAFDGPRVAGATPSLEVRDVGKGWQRISFRWSLLEEVQRDDLAVEIRFLFHPDFHWMSHLAPEEGRVAAQHVFRSPAILAASGETILSIVPDLDPVGHPAGCPWYLNLDAPGGKATVGLSLTEIPVHVGFREKPGMVLPSGQVEVAFFVSAYRQTGSPVDPWDKTRSFLWERWATPLFEGGEPGTVPLDRYVEHTTRWAFESWQETVWQEFDLESKRVGAPQFIVNESQSPNYTGEWFQREFLSIWNQALRSASGLARLARQTSNPDLLAKANLTKELALAAPIKDGLFPSVIATPNERVEIEGKRLDRPGPWSKASWTNSNRCPRGFGITPDWYHLLDASWTCLQMLRWHEDIEPDPRLLDYSKSYADRLLTLQDEEGFFPGWLHPETLEPGRVMNQTPETAVSVTFLLELARLTQRNDYRQSALRALDAMLVEIVPDGRCVDFETYWPCCPYGGDTHLGKKFERNDQYKQNTLSIYWTAEALLAAYEQTGQDRYLAWRVRTLHELSMYQQVWQPPFIHVPALGGFGVMNFDGEWNDSRQSLFAELFLDYYSATGCLGGPPPRQPHPGLAPTISTVDSLGDYVRVT